MSSSTPSFPAKILVVDDTAANLGILVDHLEGQGYEVLVALSGEEAVERLSYVQPDLILLDVMMPGIDGFETSRRLKEDPRGRDIPVIFMTALTDVNSKVAAFEAGGVDYISKPFQVDELTARVRTHLSLRAAQVRLEQQAARLAAEVAARKLAETFLQDSELRHRRLFESAADGILVIDCETAMVSDLNASLADMLGVPAESLKGRPVNELEAFRALGGAEAMLKALAQDGQMQWDEWRWKRDDGSEVCAEVAGTVYRVKDRELAQCTFRDTRARHEAEARIRYLALHDGLTGLPNRTLLMDRVGQAIGQARRDKKQVGLLLLDLDHFKHINDSLGHFVGDGLLEEVARRLRSVLRETDTAARLGGDEFVVAATGLESAADAETLARRITEALAPSCVIDGHELHIGASIGISLFPADGDSGAALLRAADTAMYQAKKNGRSGYRLFTPDMSVAAERWHRLSNDLRGACERGELVIEYQPQLSADSATISAFEALVRWRHPVEGVISPELFIPLLEEQGGIIDVGRWVLRTACAQNAAWQAQGLPKVRVAVNLSAKQFYDGDILNAVSEALELSGLAPEWLELELTESVTLDGDETTLRIMHELKALGVHLALDDFGTGWSSLSYLRQFPLDRLKIDRSFVRDLVSDASTGAIVDCILDLARSLNLNCVAEGVETREQLARLRIGQCPEVQGFLFSAAIPASQVPGLLADGRAVRDWDVDAPLEPSARRAGTGR
jgi:diguanylate cyclase (GGDEF)-like protein/PAS domain S-box-containing protein